jgi:hypothetical protein
LAAFKANIQGLGGVLNRIKQYDEALATGVDNILTQAATNVANAAKATVAKDTQALANSIGVDTSVHNSKVVGTDLVYGAYLEFGTGEFVFDAAFPFTAEQKAYAKQFYVSGKGRLHSKPYLFPALEAEIPKTLQKIRRLFFGEI